jgi:anti-anti-sigma regulatory factor
MTQHILTGGYMKSRTTETMQPLSGDWTISGVENQVDSLSRSLLALASARNKKVHVDCGGIDTIDMSGLQLLHVWLECASARGIQAKLVNLPDDMYQTIKRLGLGHCFPDSYPDVV